MISKAELTAVEAEAIAAQPSAASVIHLRTHVLQLIAAIRELQQQLQHAVSTGADFAVKTFIEQSRLQGELVALQQSSGEVLVSREEAAKAAESWEDEKHVNPARAIASAIRALPAKG